MEIQLLTIGLVRNDLAKKQMSFFKKLFLI